MCLQNIDVIIEFQIHDAIDIDLGQCIFYGEVKHPTQHHKNWIMLVGYRIAGFASNVDLVAYSCPNEQVHLWDIYEMVTQK